MQNKVTVTIAGQEYILMAAENAEYMKRVAAHVDEKVTGVLAAGRVSLSAAAVLAAVNIADEFFKEQDVSRRLRLQLKEYMEEINTLKDQISDDKREIFRLQNQVAKAKKGRAPEKPKEEKAPGGPGQNA